MPAFVGQLPGMTVTVRGQRGGLRIWAPKSGGRYQMPFFSFLGPVAMTGRSPRPKVSSRRRYVKVSQLVDVIMTPARRFAALQ